MSPQKYEKGWEYVQIGLFWEEILQFLTLMLIVEAKMHKLVSTAGCCVA